MTNREGCDSDIDSVGCYDIYEVKIRPCTTDAFIYLVDADTQDSLGFETISLSTGTLPIPIDSANNYGAFYKDIKEGQYAANATANGYFSKDTTLTLGKCEENIFKIPLCAPTLTIQVFGAEESDSIPLDNFQLTLIDLNRPDDDPITLVANNAKGLTTKVLPNTRYLVKASHQDYDPLEKESEQILACNNILNLILPKPDPGIMELDSAIVCYFEHDKPDRIRNARQEVIRSRERESEFSFTSFFPDYNNLGDFYTQEFIKNKRGEQRLTDSLNVQDFFQNKVIVNNTRLVNFRNTLYRILSTDPTVKYDLEIVGYCSSTGSTAYNKKLASRRVECVIKFFLEEFEGKKINPQQLSFTKVYKGEDDFTPQYPDTDRTNSVYNPFSSDQRRVEVASYTRMRMLNSTLGANDLSH